MKGFFVSVMPSMDFLSIISVREQIIFRNIESKNEYFFQLREFFVIILIVFVFSSHAIFFLVFVGLTDNVKIQAHIYSQDTYNGFHLELI